MVKYKFGYRKGFVPYLRGGVGLYIGSEEFTFPDEKNEIDDYKIDFKNAFGFNVGARGRVKIK